MRGMCALLAVLVVWLGVGCAPTGGTSAPASGGQTAAAPADPAAAPAAASPPAPPVKVRAAVTSLTGSGTPLWAGIEAGYFRQEGLDIEYTAFPNGTEAVSALMANEVDFLQGAGSTTVGAIVSGAELVVLATTVGVLILNVMSRPEITQPADLRGKALGISRFGTSTDSGARLVLRHWGLEPERDVALVQGGSTASIVGALESNRIQAGMLGHPTVTQARKMGFNTLIDLGTLNIPYFNSGVGTRRNLVAERADVARRYLRGIIAGLHRVRNDKPFGLEIYRKYLQTDEVDLLEDTYEVYGVKYAPLVPYPDAAAIQGVLDELATDNPRAKEMTPRDVYDDRFVRELDESGWIRGLSR